MCVPWSFLWYEVVDRLVMEEVKGLEGIEYEVTHVLVHISPEDSTIEIINSPTTIHHLHKTRDTECEHVQLQEVFS